MPSHNCPRCRKPLVQSSVEYEGNPVLDCHRCQTFYHVISTSQGEYLAEGALTDITDTVRWAGRREKPLGNWMTSRAIKHQARNSVAALHRLIRTAREFDRYPRAAPEGLEEQCESRKSDLHSSCIGPVRIKQLARLVLDPEMDRLNAPYVVRMPVAHMCIHIADREGIFAKTSVDQRLLQDTLQSLFGQPGRVKSWEVLVGLEDAARVRSDDVFEDSYIVPLIEESRKGWLAAFLGVRK